MTPYYNDGTCVIYHGDWRDTPVTETCAVVVTDPPYGISYLTGARRKDGNARSIAGDEDTGERDAFLEYWEARPALLFGSYKVSRPPRERATLVWDQDSALGMGDLRLPWKPSWALIHVCGGPWGGGRDCGSVYRCPPVQSVARLHPHQKPVALLGALLDKCIGGTVLDPFMGAGSLLVAAKSRGRRAVGVEIEERYCEVAARRLGQGVLELDAS